MDNGPVQISSRWLSANIVSDWVWEGCCFRTPFNWQIVLQSIRLHLLLPMFFWLVYLPQVPFQTLIGGNVSCQLQLLKSLFLPDKFNKCPHNVHCPLQSTRCLNAEGSHLNRTKPTHHNTMPGIRLCNAEVGFVSCVVCTGSCFANNFMTESEYIFTVHKKRRRRTTNK